MKNVTFRPYCSVDNQACTSIFDANCPEFFAPNEREEYQDFLECASEGYEVCEVDGRVLGAFGLFGDGQEAKTLNWILLDPQTHGMGIGSRIMERVILLGRTSEAKIVRIAASPLLADEALLLNGGDDTIAVQQAGGTIVRGTEPKDPGFIGGRQSSLL